ncbi:ECA4 [Symbiodinium natans]|uniref:ECA4 protein n=1 Tax=Symbiodinium natans TaxID=878477 RepID=A0A812NEK7_9DINO|nr:ECA4 [Symbiodinium natans]
MPNVYAEDAATPAEEEPAGWKDEQALEEATVVFAEHAEEEEGEQDWQGEGDAPKPDEEGQPEEGELTEEVSAAAEMDDAAAETTAGETAAGEEAKLADEVVEEEKEDGGAWWTEEKPTAAEGEQADHAEQADQAEAAAPASDDPAGCVDIDVGWETTAWLLEEDGRRLRKLERLAGGEAEATEEGQLKVTPSSAEPPPGGCGTGHSWCELCARALCAMRTGEDVELPTAVVEAASSVDFADGLGILIMEVPAAVSKKPISGKDGAKLLELCDSLDVVAVFTTACKEATGGGESQGFAEGDVVEGKFGNSWFSAVVVEAAEPGSQVKVKWDFDSSEAELEASDVQLKEAKAAAEAVEYHAGDKVEAKYGSSFFDAQVLEVTEDGKVKIKWGHDSSEAELDASEVKPKEDSQEKGEAEGPPADLKEGDKARGRFKLASARSNE